MPGAPSRQRHGSNRTGGIRALVAMGLALLLVGWPWLRKRRQRPGASRPPQQPLLVALLTDLELKPITALRTFRHLNALGIWAFWTVLLFQTSEVIVTLSREGTRNSTGLVWCGVSVGLAFIALSL